VAAAANSSTCSVRLLLGLPAATHIPPDELADEINRGQLCKDYDVREALVQELLCSGGGRFLLWQGCQSILGDKRDCCGATWDVRQPGPAPHARDCRVRIQQLAEQQQQQQRGSE
jgi:hypothetical protein